MHDLIGLTFDDRASRHIEPLAIQAPKGRCAVSAKDIHVTAQTIRVIKGSKSRTCFDGETFFQKTTARLTVR